MIEKIKLYFRIVRHALSHVPLIGPIFYAGGPDHKEALKELLVGLVFSTVTFWLTALILLTVTAVAGKTYIELLTMTVQRGELFIFSVGLLGPVLLATADDIQDEKNRPSRLSIIFALCLIGLIASGYHAQIKGAQIENRMAAVDTILIFKISLFVALGAIVLRYLALLYRKASFEPDKLKANEVGFAQQFEQRHNSNGDQNVK